MPERSDLLHDDQISWPIVCGITSDLDENNEIRDLQIEGLKSQAKQDSGYCELVEQIRRGFPNKRNLFSESGKNFLVYVDRYSGWIALHQFKQSRTTSNNIIKPLERWFVDYGESGLSPSELVFGRQMRSVIPSLPPISTLGRGDGHSTFISPELHPRKHLSSLKIGERVRVQDHLSKRWNITAWWKAKQVTDGLEFGCQVVACGGATDVSYAPNFNSRPIRLLLRIKF
ncbi:hypothetical protein TCAL_15841 [Tigriopus californicus]|uniref:Uncharacterized protein n=1 Tax=Tigriopus californicus TaxID=6832 RepID=A0A553NP84_TIGCA|nr:hypothetical protein TCAL_15841 [Tigriopus californicus]